MFTETFGGATLYPSGQSYLSLTFSVDQTLAWPIEQQVGGDVVSSIMDLNATGSGLNVDIPDARQVSNGIQSVFNNVGSNTITIRDNAGGTIISLAPAEAWVVYLTDNSTAAGTWRIFQLGASVSTANASALAGAGLKAVSTTLNQTASPTSASSTPHTWTDADRAQFTIWTGGVGVLNLPVEATVGSDWFSMIRNSGSGDLTVTPPGGTIDGGSTLVMGVGESAIIITDGTNWFTVGHGQSTTSVFDFISIAVPGSGDFTLSGVELNRISYEFTGILTGNRSIIVPNSVQQYWVDNATTGAFTLDVKTSAQVTPILVLQGDRHILYCDGTDVVGAESATVSFPIVVSQGGTGANNAASARTNLSVPVNTLNLIAGAGMTGGGNLTADRTFNVIAGTGITVNANDVALDTSHARNVDHTAVTITAGAGMTGGGAIDANRTLNCIAGTGITVNANDIALDTSNTRNVDHGAVSITAGLGLTGGGTIAATRTVDVGAGAGITVNANDVALDTSHARNVDHSAVSVIAGAGLTGGGTIAANRTVNVIANADGSIVVNANDIIVGVLATDAQHGVRGGGTQHATATLAAQGFVELATQAEVDAGADSVRAVTPSTLLASSNIPLLVSGTVVESTLAYSGWSTDPIWNFTFEIIGNLVILLLAPTGGTPAQTSNSVSMSVANFPADIRPTTGQVRALNFTGRDNGANISMHMTMSTGGNMAFFPATGATSFTASGSKGLVAGQTLIYTLD